jgi:hypothetical protein
VIVHVVCLSFVLAAKQPAMDHLRPAETVAAAHLTEAETRAIFDQLDKTSFDTPDSWNTEALARRVRLGNSDGLVIQGSKLLCGATGNCQIWVFRRTNDGWHNLFPGQAPLASTFGFEDAASNGLPNLVLETHLSAGVTRREVYTFNARSYQPRGRQNDALVRAATRTTSTRRSEEL